MISETAKKSIIGCVSAAVAAGVLFFAGTKLLPVYRINTASELYEAGNYGDALIEYAALGDYRDCPQMVLECRRQLATESLDAGRYAEALEEFRALGDYSDCAEKVPECVYGLAVAAYEAGDIDGAQEAFSSLGGYAGSEEFIKKCEYRRASLALLDGDTAGARAIFTALGEYEDCRERLKECDYADACVLLEAGEYIPALESFEALGDYSDSAEKVEMCRGKIYIKAKQARYLLSYEEAVELYTYLGDYRDSPERLQATLDEKWIFDNAWRPSQLLRDNWTTYINDYTYDNGMTYYLSGYGSQYGVYVYVPYEINEDTSYMIYYCGGTGQEIESILWAPGVVHYFASSRDPEKYSPNAICIFYGTSGYDNIPTRVIDTLKLLHDVSEETGAPVKDVITVGSSNGCYTALHLAAALYTEGGIPVRCSLSLDAGLEWMHDYDWLTPEECDALVESGCTLYLFEQEGVGLEKEGIRLMVEKGVKTVVVECRVGDHNMISENAYNYGIFSWGVHEFDILNPLEYIFVPLTQEKLQEYYDSTG